ncbi:restriction endonuclease subunit S [Vibrio vulnificus]|uniref:restriction endonuclease subunit S n=1 Tax=Vibrio vulnificus TaxID=672 RepID=UPI001CDBDC09|nr:restriction endonuclease subunit S [Vibrio vulnificus]MCA3902074.1 restriction endonuclease subunit S [Vibrio vulnificus]
MHQNSPYTLTKIGSLIDLLSGFAFKSSEFSDVATTEQHIRLLRGINITENAIRNNDTIDKFWLNSSTDLDKYYLEEGDLVISMDGSKVGRNYALVSPKDLPSLLVQRVARIRAKKGLHLPFLHQLIGSKLFTDYVDSVKTSSGIPHISAKQIKEFSIPLPNIAIQKKIAEILSTVDKKIDLIDQKIAETEKLKTGLMQKLFSEGIGVQDSDGNWQPHSEFQDSPFGKIPKCWSVETLGEHTIKVGSGVTPKGGSKAYVDSGIPLIRSQNVLFGKFKLDDVAFITEQQHDKMKGSKLQPRDVLLNITGASIGRCAVLPEDFDEGNVNQHVCIIRTSEAIDPDFCGWFLNSKLGQKQIWNLQAGGNREGLNFQQIRSFKIPVFSIEEQCSIVEILSTVSDKLNLLETQKAETQQLKKGLMQKLLTGEWRVPLDNPEAA